MIIIFEHCSKCSGYVFPGKYIKGFTKCRKGHTAEIIEIEIPDEKVKKVK